MAKLVKKWGYYRCHSCRAFSRQHCAKCEHCKCNRPKGKKRY